MDAYRLVLFCHVLAVVGLFAALAIEWVCLRHVRASTSGGASLRDDREAGSARRRRRHLRGAAGGARLEHAPLEDRDRASILKRREGARAVVVLRDET
jgi:hypothetical protein